MHISATRLLPALFVAATFLCGPANTYADTLTGATVTGSLSALDNTSVTTQFTSPATVGPGGTFSGELRDATIGFDFFFINVNIFANSFSVDVRGLNPGVTNVYYGYPAWAITLGDLPSFVGGFTLSSYTCDAIFDPDCVNFNSSGLTSNTFANSAVTLDFNSLATGQSYVFTEQSAPTPEPSSLILLGTGILSVAATLRRRLAS
jgi:hypothetical protein